LVVTLKKRLLSRMEFWRAEARSHLAERKSELKRASAPFAEGLENLSGILAKVEPSRLEPGALTEVPDAQSTRPSVSPRDQATLGGDRSRLELATEVARRKRLLEDYKAATQVFANRKIYVGKSGIHKPEFYDWLNGTLPADSATSKNFERFLREKKPPISRKPID
jgi:hypothetical protein